MKKTLETRNFADEVTLMRRKLVKIGHQFYLLMDIDL